MFSSLVVPAPTNGPERIFSDSFQSPFGVYAGNAPWDEEVVFLYQLARYLRMHPDAVGHIVYYSDERVSRKRLERRLVRSVRYIMKSGNVARKRLKVYYGGEKERSSIYLQPLAKDNEPPASPK